ncbi:MAG: 3-oxoacyl-ACP synthase, partial [Bacteroidales bacterium]|nr:3-oxoacyl-ACP synthase [Bacteroidales bacterium]
GLRSLLTGGKIMEGQKVLLAGFGVGLSWAATVIEM